MTSTNPLKSFQNVCDAKCVFQHYEKSDVANSLSYDEAIESFEVLYKKGLASKSPSQLSKFRDVLAGDSKHCGTRQQPARSPYPVRFRWKMFLHSVNEARQARAECRGSMALPRGNSKTGTGKALRLHHVHVHPLTHHRGLRGGHTARSWSSVKEGRLGHLALCRIAKANVDIHVGHQRS